MDAKTLQLVQAIASDGDLAANYPQYREAALEILFAAPAVDAETFALVSAPSPSHCYN